MTVSQHDEWRFLVLNTKADWDRGLPVALQTSDAGLALDTLRVYTAERTIELQGSVAPLDIADVTIGPCQTMVILDAAAPAVWLYDPFQTRFERIACVDVLFSRPIAVASTPRTLYVADEQAAQRLFALAQMNGQIRWTIGAVHDATGQVLDLAAPFAPIDLAVDDDANVYALDRSNRAIVHIDRAGRVVAVFGRDELAGSEPVAITCSCDGVLYVLDRQNRQVIRFSDAGSDVFIDLQTLPFEIEPSDVTVDRHGQLYIGDGRALPEDEEDDRFIHIFTPEGVHHGQVPVYRGAVAKLLVDATHRIFVFNEENKQIVVLRLQQTFIPPEGYYFSKALDSTTPGTSWHKLVLETQTPDDTQVRVSYLIADEKAFLQDGIADLDAFLDDEEIPLEQKVERLHALAWSTPLLHPHDALIRSPTGRYLWLRLQLIGNAQHTPTVQSLRVDFPRLSYLRYLPAVYQEDGRSRDFLERFLALFETFFAHLEGRIDHIVRYFDADAVEGAFLRWLASWLAMAVDEQVTEGQLRELVRRAPELYAKRGTRVWVEEMVQFFTGETPFIIEHAQLQCAQSAEVRQLLAQLYGSDPYCFCVLLKPFQVQSDDLLTLLKRFIDADKPVHTCAGLQVLPPWIYLDMHTYLGVNTYLSQPSPRLDSGSALPRDTVLTDADEAGQIERRARLGTDTVLT